jgi:hypothetical protein
MTHCRNQWPPALRQKEPAHNGQQADYGELDHGPELGQLLDVDGSGRGDAG